MVMSINIKYEEAATLVIVMDLVRPQVSSVFNKANGVIKGGKMTVMYRHIRKTVKKEIENNDNEQNVTLEFNSSQFEMLSEFVKEMIDLFKNDSLHDTWHESFKKINYEILQATIDNADMQCTNVNA